MMHYSVLVLVLASAVPAALGTAVWREENGKNVMYYGSNKLVADKGCAGGSDDTYKWNCYYACLQEGYGGGWCLPQEGQSGKENCKCYEGTENTAGTIEEQGAKAPEKAAEQAHGAEAAEATEDVAEESDGETQQVGKGDVDQVEGDAADDTEGDGTEGDDTEGAEGQQDAEETEDN